MTILCLVCQFWNTWTMYKRNLVYLGPINSLSFPPAHRNFVAASIFLVFFSVFVAKISVLRIILAIQLIPIFCFLRLYI